MQTPLVVYGLARNYLLDRRSTLEPNHYSIIEGYLRSRNVEGLSTVFDTYGESYNNPESIRTLRQLSAFVKKHRDLSDPVRCENAALTMFQSCERRCRITNKRLDYYFVDQPSRLYGRPDLFTQVERMKAWISGTLGSFEDFLEELPSRIRVTSGATSTRSRRASLPHLKVSKRLACTPAARPYLESLSLFYGYGALRPRYVLWNRVEAVPKNWKTHRIIACEPEGNLSLQLAFDAYAKERLARKGIDLRDQSLNQRLALEGSMTGKLATVDLSSASDTLAWNVPVLLFPYDWYTYLAKCRTPMFKICIGDGDSKAQAYAKFSSMGNGATFAIESLVFAAACHAVGAKTFNVYGDDIVIDVEKVEALSKLLRFLGFRINEEKSYATGSFRESCGKDYFAGVDVTPFYLRYEDGRKTTLCHIVNCCASLAEHGALWAFLKEIVIRERLPFAPVSLSTMSGVWLSVGHAYRARLIKQHYRSRHWVPHARAFVAKRRNVKVWDIRGLFLWYLRNQEPQEYPKVTRASVLSGSLVPTSTTRYSRQWVPWHPATAGKLPHLYGWSDYISGS